MRSYVLIGNPTSKEEFINKFVEENNIPSYNILTYADKLGIPDVREIKRTLSFTPGKGNKRLIIIAADPTIEAQNALLKTLEELDDDTTFIFSGEQELLPTIVSRSNVLRTEDGKQKTDSGGQKTEDGELVRRIIETDSASGKLLLLDKFFNREHDYAFSKLILSTRDLLFEALLRNDNVFAKKCYPLFKSLTEYNELIKSNNLNQKLTAERAILALQIAP